MLFFEESEHCKTELQSENPVRNGGVFIFVVGGAICKGEVTLSHGLFPIQRSSAAVHWRDHCLNDFLGDFEMGVLFQSQDDCVADCCRKERSIRIVKTNRCGSDENRYGSCSGVALGFQD